MVLKSEVSEANKAERRSSSKVGSSFTYASLADPDANSFNYLILKPRKQGVLIFIDKHCLSHSYFHKKRFAGISG